jgi:hypothetical protein
VQSNKVVVKSLALVAVTQNNTSEHFQCRLDLGLKDYAK